MLKYYSRLERSDKVERINRASNTRRNRSFDGRRTDVATEPVRQYFSDVVNLKENAAHSNIPPLPSGTLAADVELERRSPSELIPEIAYYQSILGIDKESYEYYKNMVARTLNFSAAFADARTNAPFGYHVF